MHYKKQKTIAMDTKSFTVNNSNYEKFVDFITKSNPSDEKVGVDSEVDFRKLILRDK